jgi:hypothetical protein
MSQVHTIAQPFLDTFYTDALGDYRFSLWTKHNRSHTWHSDVESGLKSVNASTDTYFSMAIYPKGVTKRTIENASAIFGVWLDVDCGEKDNGKTYFPKVDEALAWVLDALAGRWTYIIHSGTGLHVYLLLDEPFWIETDDDRIYAQKLTKGFHRWANAMCPYEIDALWDLARIMRLPGTTNTASGTLCHVVDECRTEVSASDLRDFLPDVEIAEVSQVAGSDDDVDPAQLKSKLAMLAEQDEAFKKTWERRRRMTDNSPSAYCMAIANQLVMTGFGNSEIVAAMRMWRAAQMDAKEKPLSWYEGTLAKARSMSSDDVLGNKVTQAASGVVDGDGTKLGVISTVFKREVTSITRRVVPEHKGNKEKCSYLIQFKEGSLIVPSTEVLMSQARIRILAFEEEQIMMPKMKGPKWDDFLTLLLSEMEDDMQEVEANLAFNVEQELKRFVFKKRENVQVVDDLGAWEPAVLYEQDEIVYFAWPSFKVHMQSSGYNISNKGLAAILKGIGCAPKQFTNVGRTRLWSVPGELS